MAASGHPPLLAPSHRRLKFCSSAHLIFGPVPDLFSTNFLCEGSEWIGAILAPLALTGLAGTGPLTLRWLRRGLRLGLRWLAY